MGRRGGAALAPRERRNKHSPFRTPYRAGFASPRLCSDGTASNAAASLRLAASLILPRYPRFFSANSQFTNFSRNAAMKSGRRFW